MLSPDKHTPAGRQALAWTGALVALFALALWSLSVGVSDVSWNTLWSDNEDDMVAQVLMYSRVPRTLALMLAGSAMAVAGLLMQMLARNHFVEPSTMGTVESATLGMLFCMLVAPDLPVFAKMGVSALTAMAGTALFMAILSRIRLRSAWIVPLVGLILAGVIEAATTFWAYQYDMIQSLRAFSNGDFSVVIEGRYEMLWLSLGVTGLAVLAADRFTVAGLGESFATNLGLNYKALVLQGLIVVSVVTACVVVTVGSIPFVGLIVPNLVRLMLGDNVRRSVWWVAIAGAALTMLCDLFGRLIIAPYEIPVGTVMGVVGSGLFLAILLRRRIKG
ncbi:ABC transporter permease [Comamonas kerstersii]|jgi:iron complex transport system permease protein|uniref:Iron ABC transporter permease n=1 Tax=Comamonas kerstersii TaxID=225992 RepID=A0A1V0BDW8_9BURK|nr:iron chelate uptake ABC transporter family permease subunit [Comamonas kerstersii]AQZ98014.1 iron ABC transporter permease [Comamonas kerstersii]QTW19433.1 iron chelate uptake ABC transporter family permease subunit [Comamonas kerstersii]